MASTRPLICAKTKRDGGEERSKIIYIFKYITLNTSCQHCLAVVGCKP